MHVLLTGEPRSGKSTLLCSIIEKKPVRTGLITLEVLNNGIRTGFEVVSSTGKRALLASITLESPIRVGKYFVHVQEFEALLDELFIYTPKDFLYLDEIGEMQLLSPKFIDLTRQYIASDNKGVGTISLVHTSDFLNELRENPEIKIVEVTSENRDILVSDILAL